MSEHRDNTTERDAPSPEREAPEPVGSYYYDDATGYEIYDPSRDDEEEVEEKDGAEDEGRKAEGSCRL